MSIDDSSFLDLPACGELVRLQLYGGQVVDRVFLFSMPLLELHLCRRTKLLAPEPNGPDLAFLRHRDGAEGGLPFSAMEGAYGSRAAAKARELGLGDIDTWILSFDMSRVSRK